tara:strand:- start:5497 stop:6225 length:729 start_codon:yes stop_codon:yes gene_type:complete
MKDDIKESKELEKEDLTNDSPSPEDAGTPVPEAVSTELDSVADTILANQPEVNAAAGSPQTPEAKKPDIIGDDFARDSDGNIKYKKDGKTPMKKRGRKAGSSSSVINNVSTERVQNDKELIYAKTGEVTGNFLISMSMMVGGDDFAPVKDDTQGIDERAAINDAFRSYYKATGKEDLPPNIALVMVLSAYLIPRFFMEKTQSRVLTLKDKFNLWREHRRIKKSERNAELGKEKDKETDKGKS